MRTNFKSIHLKTYKDNPPIVKQWFLYSILECWSKSNEVHVLWLIYLFRTACFSVLFDQCLKIEKKFHCSTIEWLLYLLQRKYYDFLCSMFFVALSSTSSIMNPNKSFLWTKSYGKMELDFQLASPNQCLNPSMKDTQNVWYRLNSRVM